MQKILIFPYNGNALEAIDCLGKKFELIGFIDDTPEKQGEQKNGLKVYSRSALTAFPDAKILAVPGSPLTYLQRKESIESLNVPDNRFVSVIHPNASLSPLAKMGYNLLIMAGVVITSNAELGNHVCILPNTVIHHDVKIGDLVLIGSNVTLAGGAILGTNCYIGSGSNIMNGIQIGEKTLIGIGSNVISNIAPFTKAAGNPARQL